MKPLTATGEIHAMAHSDKSALQEFLHLHPGAVIPTTYDVDPEVVLHVETAVLLETIEQPETASVAAYRDGSVQGVACVQRMQYDSSIYGMEMAEVTWFLASGRARAETFHGSLLGHIIAAARERGIRHLSCRIPIDDIGARHALERAGFLLMGTSVEYSWKPLAIEVVQSSGLWTVRTVSGASRPATRISKCGASFRPCSEDDLPALQEIARLSFTQDTLSRYAADPALPLEHTGQFYAQWIHNAYTGTFGDVVMVGCLNDRPIGFLAFRREKRLSELLGVPIGSIGIGAVDSEFRGRGVFPGLMASILQWCRETGIGIARARTFFENPGTHRAFLATGGTLRAGFHSFHRLGN